MPPMPIPDLIAAYRAERLSRDEFARAMQPHHAALAHYAPLVENPDLDRIEIRAGGVFVVFGSGVRMYWNADDSRSAPSLVINEGHYPADDLSLLTRLAADAQTILDIGANAGFLTLHMAQAVAPRGGRVLAFEPVPATFHQLGANILVNDLEQVVSGVNVALGDREGQLTFYVPENQGSAAASARPLFPQEANQHVQVRMVRLDDFAAEHPFGRIDLVKCDVDGAELAVLRGALETIRRHSPILAIETMRKWTAAYDYVPQDVVDLLCAVGYECWSFADGGFEHHAELTADCPHTSLYFLKPDKHAAAREAIERG